MVINTTTWRNTMSIQSYSARPSAVRGLARYLGNANTQDVDLNSLITRVNDKFVFDTDAADKAVGLNVVDEIDVELVLACGTATCPSCGVHLSNGLSDFEGMVDRFGSTKEAYNKGQKHEWACMGCGHEFGKAIEPPVATAANKPTKTGRKYPNRAHSDIESPSDVVFGLADAMKDAKRKDVVDAAIAKGVTPNTARAAYQHWRKARGLTKAA
jgi:ferredoxin